MFGTTGRQSVMDKNGKQTCAIQSCGNYLGVISTCKQGFPALRQKCGNTFAYLGNSTGAWA